MVCLALTFPSGFGEKGGIFLAHGITTCHAATSRWQVGDSWLWICRETCFTRHSALLRSDIHIERGSSEFGILLVFTDSTRHFLIFRGPSAYNARHCPPITAAQDSVKIFASLQWNCSSSWGKYRSRLSLDRCIQPPRTIFFTSTQISWSLWYSHYNFFGPLKILTCMDTNTPKF